MILNLDLYLQGRGEKKFRKNLLPATKHFCKDLSDINQYQVLLVAVLIIFVIL